MADLGVAAAELAFPTNLQEPIGLKDLSQELFGKIAVKLDPKSLLCLKATCRALHIKSFYAQRLITIPLDSVEYTNVRKFHRRRPDYRPRPGFQALRPLLAFQRGSNTYLEEFFFRTGFSFHAEEFHTKLHLTNEDILYLSQILIRRVTAKRLRVECDPTAAASVFNALLKVLHPSELQMTATLPHSCFDYPEFLALESLYYPRPFQNSLRYLLIASCHTFLVDLVRRRGRDDSSAMRDVLKKWEAQEKEIWEFTIRNFNFDEKVLFRGWQVLDDEEKAPEGQTVVIQDSKQLFRVIRRDSAVLYVRFFCDQMMISATELTSLDWE